MSYYYDYYIGYEREGKIYPLGPYVLENKLVPVFSRSHSFASRLHEEFYNVDESQASDELRNEFEYEDWNGKKVFKLRYLPVKELPNESYIKTGYFLIKDVEAYEMYRSNYEHYEFDGFYDVLSPTLYAAKLQNELLFGKNKPTIDEGGNEYTEPNASDYMYYAYCDEHSKEYEAHILRFIVREVEDYHTLQDGEYVILLREG